MAEVLCVYRQVKLLKKRPPSDAVAIVSYDEKPGVQAIENTAPDLPPEPGIHPSFGRDHEYKRHSTVTLGDPQALACRTAPWPLRVCVHTPSTDHGLIWSKASSPNSLVR